MSWKFALPIVAAMMLGQAAVTGVAAHILNEATQFSDIKSSDARFDIMMLIAAGVLPQGKTFGPDQPLTRRDLASWVAVTNGFGGGEKADPDALAGAALKAGAVDSLEGNATYGDLLKAFFAEGEVKVEARGNTPTKGEAAGLLASNFSTLLGRLSVTEGPRGAVSAVEAKTAANGSKIYLITIGNTTAPAYGHARVANGPTDFSKWQGMTVRRSLTREINGNRFWVFLEADAR